MAREAVEVIGLEQFAKFTESLQQKIKDEAGLTEEAASYMRESTIKKIQTGEIEGEETSDFTLSLRRGGGGRTLMNTGRLLQSIEQKGAAVGSNLAQAAIQNNGGTIKPKEAKYLTIPACHEAAKLSEIVNTRGALEHLKRQGWEIWFAKGAIMGKKSKRGKAIPLFYLKKEVEIPARRYLYISETDEKVLKEICTEWLSY